MNRNTIALLCDPVSREALYLEEGYEERDRQIYSGWLSTSSGKSRYPIVQGIPRFLCSSVNEPSQATLESVRSFGDEWNHFNFIGFKPQWLNHTVMNTFGSPSVFRDKLIVDAGAGSGAQSLWMLEFGARHVLVLELSHSVDDAIANNLASIDPTRYDIIQCSIDLPPVRDGVIDGMVYCHNVIQHTPSVHDTAWSLWRLLSHGGEFVFNCYPLNDQGIMRWIRWHFVFLPLRKTLSRTSFKTINMYAKTFSVIRGIPVVGQIAEKVGFGVQGDVPRLEGEKRSEYRRRKRMASQHNTFDAFGGHHYQHYMSDSSIRELVSALQPDSKRIKNIDRYFARPQPIGCALRIVK